MFQEAKPSPGHHHLRTKSARLFLSERSKLYLHSCVASPFAQCVRTFSLYSLRQKRLSRSQQVHFFAAHPCDPLPGVCCVLLGLVHPRLGPPQPNHVLQRAHLPDRQSHGAAEPPCVHGAGAAQEDRRQHLQQAGWMRSGLDGRLRGCVAARRVAGSQTVAVICRVSLRVSSGGCP